MGVPPRNKTLLSYIKNDRYTLICRNKGIDRCITKQRFKKLWDNFTKVTSTQGDYNSFKNNLEQATRLYPTDSNTYIAPYEVYDPLIHHFNITIQRNATPFDFILKLKDFINHDKCAINLGAVAPGKTNTWNKNSIMIIPRLEKQQVHTLNQIDKRRNSFLQKCSS